MFSADSPRASTSGRETAWHNYLLVEARISIKVVGTSKDDPLKPPLRICFLLITGQSLAQLTKTPARPIDLPAFASEPLVSFGAIRLNGISPRNLENARSASIPSQRWIVRRSQSEWRRGWPRTHSLLLFLPVTVASVPPGARRLLCLL